MEAINYIATSKGSVLFGLAPDPAAEIVQLQAGNPNPIRLLNGWVVPAAERADVRKQLMDAFHEYRIGKSNWFRIAANRAANRLARLAREAGGTPWKVRVRPKRVIAPDDSRKRPVITPYGRYESASEAAKSLGITRQAISHNARRQSDGWYYEDDTSPPPPRPARGRPRIYY